MTSIDKIFEMFRNLRSDAVPRPPRTNKENPTKKETDEENNGKNSSNEPEEILVESDEEELGDEKTKSKKFFKPNKKDWNPKKDKHSNSTVNTQATGNVINVVNSQNVRWGNDYYMAPMHKTPFPKNFDFEEGMPEEEIKKTNDIKLLLEAKIKPEHEYIDHIAKNLGKNWQKYFIKLGYKKNRIETFVIDTEKYGVSEARYKLLLDWIENEEHPSLGRLATLLWKEGERQLVKDLAMIYKQNAK